MKDMPKLFDIEVVHPDEVKSRKFISQLIDKGFIGINKVYLKNYIDAEIGIALGHIKSGYKRYVIEGGWSEEKYEDIILLIARDRQMLIPQVFLRYGTRYDEGKLTREVTLERRKYGKKDMKKKEEVNKEEKVSKEEQELLDYIARNGGLE